MRWAILAAMLVATPASARVLVVEHYPTPGGTAEPIAAMLHVHSRAVKGLRTILDRTGADYKWVNYKSTQTEYWRNGYHVRLYGTAGAAADTFDGVIHLGFNGTSGDRAVAILGNASVGNRSRVDSMLFGGATKAPTVPQLVIMNNTSAFTVATDYSPMFDGTTCTTGVVAQAGGTFAYPASEPTRPFVLGSYSSAFVLNPTPPAGGIRALLKFSSVGAYEVYHNPSLTWAWPDSIVPGAADTAFVWMRLMSHINGAAPIMFASTAGVGLPFDSVYNANGAPLPSGELEHNLVVYALAAFDSLTGGGVWPAANKLPAKLGLTIDGGFARNARRHHRGILASDSTVLKSSIDSLATLDIPFVVGVNVDSIGNYPSEKGWWAAARRARYSPQPWTGVADTTANSGRASFLLPIDVWGRYRRRAAYGDGSAAGSDTSLWALMRGSLYKCDSIWGPDRVSRFVLPPDDDWTPLGMNNSVSGPGVDSVLLAMRLAGFRGVRVNTTDRDNSRHYLRANPKGWFDRQGVFRDVAGGKLNVLGYPGHPIGGGSKITVAIGDTTHPYGGGIVGKLYQEIYRAQQGLWMDEDWNYDAFPNDDIASPDARIWDGVEFNQKDRVYPIKRRGSLMRLSASDFSGNPSGPPARLGWWTVKSLANAFRAINNAAGRSVAVFAYPEDIVP